MARRALALSCIAAALVACAVEPDDGEGAGGDDVPPADLGKADGTTAPGFTLSGPKSWYLIENALTEGHGSLELTVNAPASVRTMDLWIGGKKRARLQKSGSTFTASVSISDLPPGKHKALLSANGGKKAVARHELVRSHPLYVFVSNDWDTPDNADPTLERQERLHQEHPELVLTHFVGPYTFTDPATPKARADELASWVKTQRDQHGDEIGLHIHPYCSFVESAGLSCRTSPSFAKQYGDPTGYTVVLSSYPKQEMASLLERADQLFEANGLGKPRSFRAGGWTAEAHTLEALAENGFVADASAANWHRMEEWKGVWGTSLYSWCETHWSQIDERTQPYYPAKSNIQAGGSPFIPLLELPDNGLLVDYVTAEEMLDVFSQNWDGGALGEPRVVSIGYHPPNFSEAFYQRIDGALDGMDAHLASNDAGPVVYATASGLSLVFQPPSE